MSTPPSPPAPFVDLTSQARSVARLAEGVREDQLDAPTPCPDYAVRHLLGHLVSLSVAFRDAARRELGPTTDTSPGSSLPELPADWRVALPGALAEMAEAWRDPAAWEGETRAGGVPLPGAVAGLVAVDELVVHGWDLARATGQEYAPDEAALRASEALLTPVEDPAADLSDDSATDDSATEDPAAGDPAAKDSSEDSAGDPAGDASSGAGLFGPPVPVPDGAPLLDRVIGLSGRDPGWRA
ncbi:TIGR03086 family metal-binding protein [Streptomyces uncialis]|uniref:TIGR03086 family metal-binding protein n=1 Tax=Streptomyces uncialis TaxID=1048205 RepID=UPI00225886EE|nr:TIGR03086 family metal-binding protein [Streptomyces uncialis]MCX4663074.1 TIGR03086 family metal-binding protein [Streptomyces uncialis]